MLATSVPSLVRMVPRARPRAPKLERGSTSKRSQSSARAGRLNHTAWSRLAPMKRAGREEVGGEGVGPPLRVHGDGGRPQGLAGHLAPEEAVGPVGGGGGREAVGPQPLQLQQLQQAVDSLRHRSSLASRSSPHYGGWGLPCSTRPALDPYLTATGFTGLPRPPTKGWGEASSRKS